MQVHVGLMSRIGEVAVEELIEERELNRSGKKVWVDEKAYIPFCAQTET